MKKIYALIHFLLLIVGISNAQYTKLLDFVGIANGSAPNGELISNGTFLYGITNGGGLTNRGAIFKIKPDGTGYAKLFDFDSTTIGGANGSLISDGTFLYGMTAETIFKIKLDGTGYSTLLVFTGENGADPKGSLIFDGNFLYGMTSHGGINSCSSYDSGCGIIFKIKPNGTGYSKLMDFGGLNEGAHPVGSLMYDGTFLYGMTRHGGKSTACSYFGCGAIFKIKPDGTGFSDLYNFDGTTNGGNPFGDLISDGIFLYGMTQYGGNNSMGTVFKIKPDGTGYSKLLDFAGTVNGSLPSGSLIYDGTFLFGMTGQGGTNDNGVIFKIKPDGTGYSKLFDFVGGGPGGSLISDGTTLYGMTGAGGSNNMGVIFSFKLSTTTNVNEVVVKLPDTTHAFTSIQQTENNNNFSVFPNPTGNTITVCIQNTNPTDAFTLRVTNGLSQIVYSEDVKDASASPSITNSFTKQIDLSHLPKGIYFVELQPTVFSTSHNATKRNIAKLILQ